MPNIAEHPEIDPDLLFDSPLLSDLASFWQRARADRAMPARADIDPTNIPPPLLPHILLVDIEYQPRRRFRWRLIGTHVTSKLRRDSTGAYWDELYTHEELTSLEIRMEWLLQHRAPLRSVGQVTPNKNYYGKVETFMAPLSEDLKVIDSVLMGADYNLRNN